MTGGGAVEARIGATALDVRVVGGTREAGEGDGQRWVSCAESSSLRFLELPVEESKPRAARRGIEAAVVAILLSAEGRLTSGSLEGRRVLEG